MNFFKKTYYKLSYKLTSNPTALRKLEEISYLELKEKHDKEKAEVEEALTDEQREQILIEKKKADERLSIEKSLAFVDRVRVLASKAKYTTYQEEFEAVYQNTKEVHHFIVNNLASKKFSITKLEQFHLYHTEEFLALFEDAFANVSTSAKIDEIIIPAKDTNFIIDKYKREINNVRESLTVINESWILNLESNTTLNEATKYTEYIFKTLDISKYSYQNYLYVGSMLSGTNLIFYRINNQDSRSNTLFKVNKLTRKVTEIPYLAISIKSL